MLLSKRQLPPPQILKQIKLIGKPFLIRHFVNKNDAQLDFSYIGLIRNQMALISIIQIAHLKFSEHLSSIGGQSPEVRIEEITYSAT